MYKHVLKWTTIVVLLGVSLPKELLSQSVKTKTFRDCTRCPEMVVIPSGTFQMGSPATEKDRNEDEGPRKEVHIRRFAVSKYDITRGEWAIFAKATRRDTVQGCVWTGRTKAEADPIGSWRNLGFVQDDRHPVVCVTWKDAQDYVHWLSRISGQHYRLLSEAEWEYAARARTDTPFPWGELGSHEYANYGADNWGGLALGHDQWINTSPVGSFQPNAFALYDMHGNVLQWLQDCFASDYSELLIDGSAYQQDVELKTTGDMAWMNGTRSCDYRRVRGGDWGDPARMIRSAARNFAPAPGFTLENYRSGGVGFRVARTLN
jgi:formylglycine-generating enzyme required for sulfatase activity